MTSVSNVQQIVAVIREQLAARAQQTSTKPGHPAKPAGSQPPRGSALELAAQRVRTISRDDPNRGRKALRVFLESVLLSELDESLVNDPEFHRMVDDIQRQMESDPSLARFIETAVGQLAGPA